MSDLGLVCMFEWIVPIITEMTTGFYPFILQVDFLLGLLFIMLFIHTELYVSGDATSSVCLFLFGEKAVPCRV